MNTVFALNYISAKLKENGYELDINDTRLHHEIYLSDSRKCDVIKLKNSNKTSKKRLNSNK